MKEDAARAHKEHVRNLLAVMGSAFVLACLIVGGMVTYYGPTGDYRLESVLLSPGNVSGLRYNEGSTAYVLDRIQYYHRNENGAGWQQMELSTSDYDKVFTVLSGDSSVQLDQEEIEQQFAGVNPSSLVLTVKPERSLSTGMQYQTFQEVHFVEDYYRVELRVGENQGNWAYFRHPGVRSQLETALGVKP